MSDKSNAAPQAPSVNGERTATAQSAPVGAAPIGIGTALPAEGDIRAEKDEAYRQRNVLVSALARMYPSGIRKTNIEGWSPDWHGCVYIDLPSGQISYHYHDSQAYLFCGLPDYTKPWDGHDKAEVEARLTAISAHEYDAARRTSPEEGKHVSRPTMGQGNLTAWAVYINSLEAYADQLERERDQWKDNASVAACSAIGERFPLDPTTEMIEAGAQRLVRWEDGSKWPDSWSSMDVRASRNDAERVWRSMWLAAESAAPSSVAQHEAKS